MITGNEIFDRLYRAFPHHLTLKLYILFDRVKKRIKRLIRYIRYGE